MIYSFEHRPESIATSHPRCRTAEYPMLIHKQIEIIYLIKGSASCVIDGTEYTMTADDVSIVFPYVPHSYNFVECEYIMLFFQPEICLDYGAYINNLKPANPIISIKDKNKLIELIWNAFEAHHPKTELGNKLAKSYINALVGELLYIIPTEKHSSEDQSSINKILIYCSENFRKSDLSITSLSKAVGISPKYCSHLINSLMNTDFRQYINSLRMFEAARLIANTDYSITRIMLDVGYENQGTFNRVFREQYGMTPKEYRVSKQLKK